MAQRVKDLVLSLLQLRSLLWCILDPCSGKFSVPQAQPKQTKNKPAFPPKCEKSLEAGEKGGGKGDPHKRAYFF